MLIPMGVLALLNFCGVFSFNVIFQNWKTFSQLDSSYRKLYQIDVSLNWVSKLFSMVASELIYLQEFFEDIRLFVAEEQPRIVLISFYRPFTCNTINILVSAWNCIYKTVYDIWLSNVQIILSIQRDQGMNIRLYHKHHRSLLHSIIQSYF